MDVIKASQAPIHFDVLEGFNFDDPIQREKLFKNPYILEGNQGNLNSKFVENPRMYKALDLTIHGNFKLMTSQPHCKHAEREFSSPKY